jgi:hypothetical protein
MDDEEIEMIEKWKYDLAQAIYNQEAATNDYALEKAVRAIYLGDKDNYERCLWKIIEILGGQEAVSFLETNKKLAYFIYCLGE